MKTVIKQFVARSLRYAGRSVLQRPWLKKHARDMFIRMPRLHALMLRVMFQAPAPVQQRVPTSMKNLSPNAQRMHRALKQAIRTRQQ